MWPFRKSFMDYPDEIRSAAHRFIAMPFLWRSYLGGSVKQIDERRAHIARKRKEAAALPEAQFRECVGLYLDYYESKLTDELHELQNRVSERELADYRDRRSAEEQKVGEVLNRNGLAPK